MDYNQVWMMNSKVTDYSHRSDVQITDFWVFIFLRKLLLEHELSRSNIYVLVLVYSSS